MVKCNNCGEEENRHIDYFDTGKKNVCPYRRSMTFVPETLEVENARG